MKEMIDIITKDLQLSERSRNMKPLDRLKNLNEEMKELNKAYENKDIDNIKEELGDVLWGVLYLCIISNMQIKEVKDKFIDKYNKRKPWIKEGLRVSPETEDMIWNKVKNQQP